MKYNPRYLKKLFNEGCINHLAWIHHFGIMFENTLPTCDDCRDKKEGNCEGGMDPIDCFQIGPNAHTDFDFPVKTIDSILDKRIGEK